MLLLRWSNNNVIHGSQRRYFFHKTKYLIRLYSSDKEKGNYVVVEFGKHSPRHEAQSDDSCDHAYKNSVSQINCNVKETLSRLQEIDVRCIRKPTFHYKGM